MANLTQFTGGTANSNGETIGSWVGTETEYTAIRLVSDPNDTDNYDPTSPNFYPEFLKTLFFVTE